MDTSEEILYFDTGATMIVGLKTGMQNDVFWRIGRHSPAKNIPGNTLLPRGLIQAKAIYSYL